MNGTETRKWRSDWIAMRKTKAKNIVCRDSSMLRVSWHWVLSAAAIWPSLVHNHMGREAGWVWAAYYYAALFDQRRRCFGGSVAQLQPRAGTFRLHFEPLFLWIEPIRRVARACLDVSCDCEWCGSMIASVSHGWVGDLWPRLAKAGESRVFTSSPMEPVLHQPTLIICQGWIFFIQTRNCKFDRNTIW